MAKVKTKWVCQNCGYETLKYIGKCPDCGNWGTLVEEVEIKNTSSVSQSVITDDKIKSIIEEENGIDLSVRMLPIVEQVLKDAQLLPTDIAEIYVIDGPGSFTGIRVGITIAKVYAWALKKKIVPLSELELLATTPFKGTLIVPYLDRK